MELNYENLKQKVWGERVVCGCGCGVWCGVGVVWWVGVGFVVGVGCMWDVWGIWGCGSWGWMGVGWKVSCEINRQVESRLVRKTVDRARVRNTNLLKSRPGPTYKTKQNKAKQKTHQNAYSVQT